jgi:NAD(P)-dependent dehydrogenase (short-subunit alcohol dehydrogenase family)
MTARVVITGASSGIGAAALTLMRARGADVVGLDVNGDGHDVLACDVRDQASVDRAMAAAIERLGGLDVVINNAGIGIPGPAGEAPGVEALAVIDVNMLGPWRVTAAALPALRASRGRVVNIASGLALLGAPGAAAYCMSKRGLAAFSDVLRAEEGHTISVTTVYPGYVRTPIHAAAAARGISLEGVVRPEPLEAAARSVARAALGRRPRRDVANTWWMAVLYGLLRHAPSSTTDRVIRARLRRRPLDASAAEVIPS